MTETKDGWREIATAERSEEPRLLWRPSMRLPWIGHWSSWNRWWTTGEVDRFHDHVPCPIPTHWMPLPTPPTTLPETEHG